MLGNDYDGQVCSIAGALEVIGERWSLLIVRDVLLGLRRFDEIQDDLGIARNVLQTRLDAPGRARRARAAPLPGAPGALRIPPHREGPRPVADDRRADAVGRPPRLATGGPPVLLEHRGCGGAVDEHRICERCGARLSVRDVRAQPGPGATPKHPLLRQRQDARAA